jgi:hypothetical protein
MKERRHDIDWLRVIVTLAVFLFHCTRFFDTEGWHLKNPEQSDLLFVRGWPTATRRCFRSTYSIQTVILVVGFFVIRWNLGIVSKLLIVTAISFPLILVLYELLVRRFNAIRFFFGMRPKEKPAAALGAFPGRDPR